MKKPAKKNKSDLSDWMQAIEKSGERMRKTQEAKVKALIEGLPAEIRKLAKHDNDMLLDVMLNASTKRFGYDKSENDIWAKLYVAARKEAVKRMANMETLERKRNSPVKIRKRMEE